MGKLKVLSSISVDKIVSGTTCIVTPIIQIISGAASGCVLTSDANGVASWETPSGGGGTLSGLTDVSLSTLTNGDILRYDSGTTSWYNEEIVEVSTNLTAGQLLCYDGVSITGATNISYNPSTYLLSACGTNIDATASAVGGKITLCGGYGCASSDGGGTGGDACLLGGDAYVGGTNGAANGGDVYVKGGNSSSPGTAVSSCAGCVIICGGIGYSGSTTTSTGGCIWICGGYGTYDNGGAVVICGGCSGGVTGQVAGNILLYAGCSNTAGGSGNVFIAGGQNTSSGTAGYVNISGGQGSSNAGGNISICGGNSTSSNGAAVCIIAGSSFGSGNGGNVCIRGGSGTVCGDVDIYAGGDLIIRACHGSGSGYATLFYNGAAKLCTVTDGICLGTNCGFATDWVATSDCRLKTNIQPISNALSVVNQLCGVCYKFCDDIENENRIGLIAQEVLPILPEIVSHSLPSDDDLKYGITDDRLGLKYDKLTAILIEAIKEQQVQINELKLEIEKIKTC